MIFVSYKRGDEPGYVGRLCDGLAKRFGADTIFRDVDTLSAGKPWKHELDKALERANIVLAVIGSQWEQQFRPQKPTDEPDYVRYELERARELEIPIIPVLLNDARPPDNNSISRLSWLNDLQTFNLRDGQSRWQTDIDTLTDRISAETKLQKIKATTFTRRHAIALGGLALAIAIAVTITLLRDKPASTLPEATTNALTAKTGTHASNLPLPLGQIAHDWQDGRGTKLFLDAPLATAEEKILNNMTFPPASGSKGDLMQAFCQSNIHCINCKASPSSASVAEADLITITVLEQAQVEEQEMRTQDGKNQWPIQQEYLPWENIDRETGRRSLYICKDV